MALVWATLKSLHEMTRRLTKEEAKRKQKTKLLLKEGSNIGESYRLLLGTAAKGRLGLHSSIIYYRLTRSRSKTSCCSRNKKEETEQTKVHKRDCVLWRGHAWPHTYFGLYTRATGEAAYCIDIMVWVG